jgi:1-acylglycerone phosphate reductase
LFILNDNMRLELRPLGIEVLHVVTGGISTKFFANSAGQKLPASSIYAPIAAEMEANLAGAESSSTQTMTPEVYAQKVVSNTLSWWPTKTMWVGGMSLLSWAGETFGWDGFRDFVIGRKYDIEALRTRYREVTEQKNRDQGPA